MLSMFKSDGAEALQKELMKNYIDEDKIQSLIDSGVNINRRDAKGRTMLFDLAAKRRIESIKILIRNGIDINAEDDYGRTALEEAADRADGMMIRFLIEHGASVNYVNSSGRTIMHDTALEENEKVFKILMTQNPDLTITDHYGRTALFDAVEGGSLEIIREIINNTDDINVVDNNGQTALFHAVLKENPEIAKFLITNGIDVNILDKKRQNALFNAVVLGAQNLHTIELLLDKGAKLNIKDYADKTLLDEILKILEIVKDPGEKVEGKYKLVNEERNYLKLTGILIDLGLAIDRVDENGKTVLYKEVERNNFDTIEFLIASGANINAQDNEGRTVLFDAVLKGSRNMAMIDYLVSHGANVDHKDYNERTVIDDLCEAVLITANNKKPSSRRFFDIDEYENYIPMLKKMLLFKPRLNVPKADGRTVIFDVITQNNLELIKVLINAGVDLNIVDNESNTPLSYMIDKGLEIINQKEKDNFLERLVFILKYRVDVNTIDKEGRTILHKAVLADNMDVVEKLLAKKVDLNIKDKQGRTALHHTQWRGNYKIARLIISAGADINDADYAGFTILNYAAILGHTKLVVVLILSGVLMYNHRKKSKAVAKFFKEREKNLDKLLNANITDEKMRRAIEEVIENLKKEIDEALED
ncbi:ankyrin repeat domain-containing protein [Halarcobacter anaerophilus]|uniref:ankyrin repeat domain-containing protein n=1 Tax=Halarcobacter anaerophilus TaxID=877500 RepID=UPI0005C805E2|nr:ankyrin repeat domain-containing protein [Halarcobacter anaerophilus]